MDWKAKYLAPDFDLWHRLWSVRLAVLWGTICGLWAALPAFQSYVTPVCFAIICVGFAIAIGLARLTNQPGLP
jgi:hypothetical protein